MDYFYFLEVNQLIKEYLTDDGVCSLKIIAYDFNKLKPIDNQEPDSITRARLVSMGFERCFAEYVLRDKHELDITREKYKRYILIHLIYEDNIADAMYAYRLAISTYWFHFQPDAPTRTYPEVFDGEMPGNIQSSSTRPQWEPRNAPPAFVAPSRNRGRGSSTMHPSSSRTSRISQRNQPPSYRLVGLYEPPPSYDSVVNQNAPPSSGQDRAGPSHFSPTGPTSSLGQSQNPFQARGRRRDRR
ncbi:hypothetical protein Xmau_01089 [Xenorhabdus mauleonii]|uniref:Uncharacterized protein n=2 Tax=Xenorhabdus mauleonii TaxID=351675 RepID=A0A1I3M8Y4_9GAMM|nr:hypothetical protein Xmau_01089 [Xenorhabdus mauleonii]SFI93499.1 hypothetical protein SAMN05421680_104206 [Xenorhabdus mauleonii]